MIKRGWVCPRPKIVIAILKWVLEASQYGASEELPAGVVDSRKILISFTAQIPQRGHIPPFTGFHINRWTSGGSWSTVCGVGLLMVLAITKHIRTLCGLPL